MVVTWSEGVSGGGDTSGAAATLLFLSPRPSLTPNSGNTSATGGVLRDEDLPLAAEKPLSVPARPPRIRRRGAPAIVCWFLLTLSTPTHPRLLWFSRQKESSLCADSSYWFESLKLFGFILFFDCKFPWFLAFSFLRT